MAFKKIQTKKQKEIPPPTREIEPVTRVRMLMDKVGDVILEAHRVKGNLNLLCQGDTVTAVCMVGALVWSSEGRKP